MELRLTELKDGESGIITSIRASQGRGCGGQWRLKKRLTDLGLTPGTKITVIKSAPFHGPLEVYVRGSRLAIGKGMAERIFVETQRAHKHKIKIGKVRGGRK